MTRSEPDGTQISAALQRAAEQAGPLRVDRDGAAEEARRRRRRSRTVAGAAVAAMTAAAAAVAATVIAVAPQDSVGSSRPSPTTSKQAPAVVQTPGYFQCGALIPWSVVGPQHDGLTLTIESLRRGVQPPGSTAVDPPPLVTYRLDSAHSIGMDPTEVYPQVLVLRDGVVVGGPALDSANGLPDVADVPVPAIGAPLYGPPWRPWPVVEERYARSRLCGDLDWTTVWADPDRYTIAVVMTPLSTESRDAAPRPDYNRLDRPLMIAEIPLSEAI